MWYLDGIWPEAFSTSVVGPVLGLGFTNDTTPDVS